MAGEAVLQSIVAELFKHLVDALKDQVSYLCCYSCNVSRLTEEVGKLNESYETVKQGVLAATNNLEVITPVVDSWMKRVEKVQRESQRIHNVAQQVHRRCKWFPVLNYSLSRDALKTTGDVIQLCNDTDRFIKISNTRLPAEIDTIPASTSQIGFKSRESLEEGIMDALKDPSVYLIAIWGVGGVGKTTMAENIEKRVREHKSMFDHVVMAVVSQQQDLQKLQRQIATALGLQLDPEESLFYGKKKLHERLRAEKNGVLIILDDLWERLDLEKVGIPSHSTHSGCKVMLTSRDKEAITSTNPSAKIFQLEILTEDESWNFFRENADVNTDDYDLIKIAQDVAKECKGLPLALKTVGCALREKENSFWENAIVELRKSMPLNIRGVVKEVYQPLLFSINHVESDEARDLFLACCLFPEDYDISHEELVRCGTGLRMFPGLQNLTEVRNRVFTLLKILISRSLLMDSSDRRGNQCVKMHDVVRDVGIWLASKGKIFASKEKHVFLISHGKEEWPMMTEDDSSYGKYTCISLQFNFCNIDIPETIDCPRLQYLRMISLPSYSRDGLRIPENFFSGMIGLRVLEGFHFRTLPPSLGLLRNLRSLHLKRCKILETTSEIGKLINLEILCLTACEIEVLPIEIGGLEKLRQLDISKCESLRRIAYGVISGLVRLEELMIVNSFDKWAAEAEAKEKDIACLAELECLDHLTILKIEISNPNVIPKRILCRVQNLKKYYIAVWACIDNQDVSKAIRIGDVRDLDGDWFSEMAIDDVELLDLAGPSCTAIAKRLAQSMNRNCPLKHLSLFRFTDVKYLAERQQNGVGAAIFPNLKYLFIALCWSLEEICNFSPPVGSFGALEEIILLDLPRLVCLWTFLNESLYLSNLKKVVIERCQSLSYLFSISIAKSLSKLECLAVSDCPVMEEIFKEAEGGREIEISNEKIEFPKLWDLSLRNLKSLCGFCKGVDRIEVPKLRSLTLIKLPSIMGKGGGHDSNIRQHFLHSLHQCLAVNNFIGLHYLSVESIHNFKCLFSHSILSGLSNLESLRVENCSNLEEVIGKDGNVEKTISKRTLFPGLKFLHLSRLPKMLIFCSAMGGEFVELLSLERLEIKNCPLMERFVQGLSDISNSRINLPFFTKEVNCPKLKYLELKELSMAGIFGEHFPIDNFHGLVTLWVSSCHRMTNIFSPSSVRALTSLGELWLEDCEEMQEVIAKEEVEEQLDIKEIFSPQLRRLTLNKLPKMHTFCHMKNDIEFPSLKFVAISNCPLLERFSLGRIHLPNLIRIEGLSNAYFATKIFFNKEISSCQIHLENDCFTISPRDLSFNFKKSELISSNKVLWFYAPDSSEGFVDAVKFPYGKSWAILGNFEIEKLEAGVVYEIMVMMLIESSIEWEEPLELKFTLSVGITQLRREILNKQPTEKWIEILVGKFTRELHHRGQLEFALCQRQENPTRGVSIKGFRIKKA